MLSACPYRETITIAKAQQCRQTDIYAMKIYGFCLLRDGENTIGNIRHVIREKRRLSMSTSIKRRFFLKSTLAAGTVGVAAGAGLLTPQSVIGAWNAEAFGAKEMPSALTALMGSDHTEPSEEIKIKAPDIAENGAVVPITISSAMKGVESVALIASNNPVPLVASFDLGEGAHCFVSTRIKMGKTGDVVAVVKTGGKLYSARKSVKVTIGGCGG